MSLSFFRTKFVLLFIELYELIIGLYLMGHGSDCITSITTPSCSLFQESSKLLGMFFILSSLSITATNSLFSIRSEISHLLRILTVIPLSLVFLASWGYGLLPKAVIFLLVALFTITTILIPENNFANKKYRLFPFFISITTMLSSLAFFFSSNQGFYYIKPLSLIAFVIALALFTVSAQVPQKCHKVFAVLSILCMQLITIQGIIENSFMLISFPLLASLFCIFHPKFMDIYSRKEATKQNTSLIKPMHLPSFCNCIGLHRFLKLNKSIIIRGPINKVYSDIEKITWISIAFSIMTFAFSSKDPLNMSFGFIVVGLASIVMPLFFILLIYDFPYHIFVLAGTTTYNILALLTIAVSGGFQSNLMTIPIIVLLVTAVYLGKNWIIIPLLTDLSFFSILLILERNAGFDEKIWYLFTCLVMITVSIIMYQMDKLKQSYAKKH